MLKIHLILIVISLFYIPSTHAHDVTQTTQDHINVTGVGEVDKEPDQAIFNISINAQELTLIEAKSVADKRYVKVLDRIKSAGIEEKYIKATRINAQPQYEWSNGKRVYKGERVSRSLKVTINDLSKVSELMQSVVESGVSSIDNLITGFQNPETLEQEVLGLAADDAKSRAQFLATRLGRKLGDAYMITEQSQSAPIYQPNIQMMRSSSALESDQAPDEMFGTQKLKATVNVSFNLL